MCMHVSQTRAKYVKGVFGGKSESFAFVCGVMTFFHISLLNAFNTEEVENVNFVHDDPN